MKTVLFQGDSITDAGRSHTDDSFAGNGYPTLVSASLGFEYPNEYRVINRGISGNRIVDLYARIKEDIINLKPDYLSILIGVNDVWHELGGLHRGVEVHKFEVIYDMLLTEIKEALPDIKIMLLEPFVLKGEATCKREDEPERWDYFYREVPMRAEVTRRIAQKHGIPCISLQEKFDLACQKAEAAYWLKDGVHPTVAGHELIAHEWLCTFLHDMKE